MEKERVYGYVLLPVAMDVPAEIAHDDRLISELGQEAAAFDLEGIANHHADEGGPFGPTFVSAGNEFEAVKLMAERMRA